MNIQTQTPRCNLMIIHIHASQVGAYVPGTMVKLLSISISKSGVYQTFFSAPFISQFCQICQNNSYLLTITNTFGRRHRTWWRHQMETFSALLALCAVNSPHKSQWRGALMFSSICAWINDWVNNQEAGDLRHHRSHYDVIVMASKSMGRNHLYQNFNS